MASPICLVNSTITTNGIDVTSGSTVTIQLQSTAGVTQWSIQCLNTDDLHDKTVINAGLSINQVTKTATFTAPIAPSDGAALIFESKVNNGLDINGRVDLSLTTRFGIFILTTAGQRVFAFDETTENNATFGWINKINNIVRLIGSGGAVGSGSAGDGLVFSSSAYNVASANSYITVNTNNIQANAASAATPSVLVARDGSGNSSFAGVTATTGTITTLGSTTGNITSVNSTTVTAGTVAATGGTTLALSATTLTLSSGIEIQGLGVGGSLTFRTESQTGSNASKAINFFVGNTVDANSGSWTAGSGGVSGTGNSGIATLSSGPLTGSANGNTGAVQISSGNNTATGNSGFAALNSGSATGTSGNVFIFPGTGTTVTGSISLGSASTSYGGGQRVIFIPNATVNPSTNPTGGGILYVNAGALTYRGSSGTVTVLGAA